MSGLESMDLNYDYYYDFELNTTFGIDEDVDRIFIYTANIIYGLRTFVPPIIIVLSLVGNIFCIKTFFLLSMGPYPSAVFLLIQCILELGFLMLYCGNDIYENFYAFDPVKHMKNRSDLNCKLLSFLVSGSVAVYHWLMFVIIAEMTYVRRNANGVRSLTHTYIKDTLACLITLFVCINVHYFWTFGIVKVEENLRGYGPHVQNYCMFTIASLSGQNHMPNYVFGKVWFFCDMLISALLPLLLVFIIMLVYCKQFRQRDVWRRGELCAMNNLASRDMKKNQSKYEVRCLLHMKPRIMFDFIEHVYPMLGVTFLICNLPHRILLTMEHAYENPQPSPIVTVISAVCEQLHHAFYAIKTIIFIIKSREVNRVTADTLKHCYKGLVGLKGLCHKDKRRESGDYDQVANHELTTI